MAFSTYDQELDAFADQRSPVPGLPYHSAHRRATLPVAIDGYRITRELGRGGACVVYLVKDDVGNPFALKIPYPAAKKPRTIGRLLEREVRLQQALDHPGIAKIVLVGAVGELPYLLLEYADGGDLAHLWEHRKAMRTTGERIIEALKLLDQVAGAIAYAHEHGVLHRDIKARNILVVGGELKVSDFGLAVAMAGDEVMHSRTATRDRMGTLGYMAPELEISAKNATVASDVYALGAMVYWMVTDVVPWADDPDWSHRPLLSTLLGEHAESRVHAVVEETFLGWIAEKPQRRPASVAVMREQIATLLRLGTAGVLRSNSASASMLAEPVATPEMPIVAARSERQVQVRTDPRVILVPELVAHRGRIGPVAVESFIGQGGFGQVFRGQWQGQQVAVKLVPETDDRAAARFRDEMRTLSSFQHPNIVRMLDVVHDPDLGAVGLVMEYLPHTLTDWLQNASASFDERVEMVCRIASGLDYLHSAGMFHFDLKPDNILVREDGSPAIADFGLAARARDAARHGGTVTYMAPEMLARVRSDLAERYPDLATAPLDERADLFGLGAIAFEIFTGRTPFVADDWAMRFAWRADLEAAIGVPFDVQPTIFRLLSSQPSARPRSAVEVVAALRPDEPYPTQAEALRRCHRPPRTDTADAWLRTLASDVATTVAPATVLLQGPRWSGRTRLLSDLVDLLRLEHGLSAVWVDSDIEGASILAVDDFDCLEPARLDALASHRGVLLGAIAHDPDVSRLETHGSTVRIIPLPAFDTRDAAGLLSALLGRVEMLEQTAAHLVRESGSRPGLFMSLLRGLIKIGAVTLTPTPSWNVDLDRLDEATARQASMVEAHRQLLANVDADGLRLLGYLACANASIAVGVLARLLARSEGEVRELARQQQAWVSEPQHGALALYNGFVRLLLRQTAPAGVSMRAFAMEIEPTNPHEAWRIWLRDTDDLARTQAGRLGALLVQDDWNVPELSPYATRDLVERMEANALWLSNRDRALGLVQLACAVRRIVGMKARGVATMLAPAVEIAAGLGDPELEAAVMAARALCEEETPAAERIACALRCQQLAETCGQANLRFLGQLAEGKVRCYHTADADAAEAAFQARWLAFGEVWRLPPGILYELFVFASRHVLAGAILVHVQQCCANQAASASRPYLRLALLELEAAVARARLQFAPASEKYALISAESLRLRMMAAWPIASNAASGMAAFTGNMSTALRHANAVMRSGIDLGRRRASHLMQLAEFHRLCGRYSQALAFVNAAVAAADPRFRANHLAVRCLLLTDLGMDTREELADVLAQAQTEDNRCLVRFALARAWLAQGQTREADEWGRQCVESKVGPGSDLRHTAHTVAARAAARCYLETADGLHRRRALAYLNEVPRDCHRWTPVRLLVEARVADTSAESTAFAREALDVALRTGMYAFALEAIALLQESATACEYDGLVDRLLQLCLEGLSDTMKQSFMNHWRNLCV
ncbi:MAG: serine/threonine protein kinase [Candidatus Schekmanbacteria bacterium]|nr:serine/threonine protein kinase [Candidatus Schekmanbacteria bacterium]